ncbi:unnamed protein product [Bursaphelenchus okinawaensis]|uniref:E3 ubiquitin-protein ligase hrd-1 n=1 Tax=Bursaphelenchus okinawaensis TaxID=465554 RepID=A0A811LG36_9BILA|nr:unnamed protein product [Bursaphelenchus okinawaensis]CAG9121808.1 unnamed protein product [Bursaphelenchus okinawaensis]
MARITPTMVVATSLILTIVTVTKAFMLKKQFYPSVVHLTKDGGSMAVLYFQGAVLGYLLFTFFRWIFFGQLRVAETEHALDRFWHAIVETCLAFTVFRDDFSPKFVIQFVVLFFFKGFHWLAEDRVDFMERSPLITFIFHARIMGIVAVLAAVDSYFISNAYFTTVLRGASVQIVFGFEYAVLLTMIFHIAMKYLLHMHDLRSVHPWEAKAVYMLYTELVITALRFILYFAFCMVMMRLHTFPLFAIRPLYLTLRSLRKAGNDVIQSRRAIHAMNNLYPLATERELTEGDNICIICREEMTLDASPKKLPCGHIFHPNCLRSWFQRQQTCPTCRTDVLGAAPGPQQAPLPGQPPIDGGLAAFLANMGLPQLQQAQQQRQQPQVNLDGNQLRVNLGQIFGNGGPQMQIIAGMGGQPHVHQQQQPVNGPFVFPTPHPFPAPPSYSGLNAVELAELEGQSRAAMEARLQALYNINTLLEAATLQFQQYLSVAPNIPMPNFPHDGGNNTGTDGTNGTNENSNLGGNGSNSSNRSTDGSNGTNNGTNGLTGTNGPGTTGTVDNTNAQASSSGSFSTSQGNLNGTFGTGTQSGTSGTQPGTHGTASNSGSRSKLLGNTSTGLETSTSSQQRTSGLDAGSTEDSPNAAHNEELRRRRLAAFDRP